MLDDGVLAVDLASYALEIPFSELQERARDVGVSIPNNWHRLTPAEVTTIGNAWTAANDMSPDAVRRLNNLIEELIQAVHVPRLTGEAAPDDDLLDTNRAAEIVGVTAGTIRKWVERGRLEPAESTSSRNLFSVGDVQRAAGETQRRARRVNPDDARTAKSKDDALTLLWIAVTQARRFGIDVEQQLRIMEIKRTESGIGSRRLR